MGGPIPKSGGPDMCLLMTYLTLSCRCDKLLQASTTIPSLCDELQSVTVNVLPRIAAYFIKAAEMNLNTHELEAASISEYDRMLTSVVKGVNDQVCLRDTD